MFKDSFIYSSEMSLEEYFILRFLLQLRLILIYYYLFFNYLSLIT